MGRLAQYARAVSLDFAMVLVEMPLLESAFALDNKDFCNDSISFNSFHKQFGLLLWHSFLCPFADVVK
jgi:hypothetical protein